VDDPEVAWAAKLEELRVGAVSHGVEWLRSALSELFRDELRPLAAPRRVDESLGAITGGWVRQKLVLIKFEFLLEVECSSHGAIL